MAQQIYETFAMLPDTFTEFFTPSFVGIKTLYVFVVELVESFLGSNPLGHKNKIQAVHQTPVFIKGSFVFYRTPKRRAGERRKFRHVHIIQPKRYDKVGCALD